MNVLTTGKSYLYYWQINNDALQFSRLQAESSPVLCKAEVGKRFNFARTVANKAVSAQR